MTLKSKLIIFADVKKGYGRWGDRNNDFHKMYVIQTPLSLFCVPEGENGHFYFVSTPQLRHCPEEWSPPTVGELWSQESSGGNRNIFISPVGEKNCLAGFMVMICIQTRTWWKSPQPSQPNPQYLQFLWEIAARILATASLLISLLAQRWLLWFPNFWEPLTHTLSPIGLQWQPSPLPQLQHLFPVEHTNSVLPLSYR